jgi:predicted nucleic acid-binding protein
MVEKVRRTEAIRLNISISGLTVLIYEAKKKKRLQSRSDKRVKPGT